MNLKQIVGLFAPPIVLNAYHSVTRERARKQEGVNSNSLQGDYTSWADALAASSGYDNEIILAKTRDASLKVKNGEAVYERDSVLFPEIQYSWPLLAGLLWVANRYEGHLNVLDFGGSLGSTYFQNQKFFNGLCSVRWNIVEQRRQVEVGNLDFADDQLKFYETVQDCLIDTQPNVIVLSGVLQYLERPYVVLRQLMSGRCSHIIIDRTPLWDGVNDRLCVQHVPADIYSASYPSWIFSSSVLLDQFKDPWKVVTDFQASDKLKGPIDFNYKGMIIAKQ